MQALSVARHAHAANLDTQAAIVFAALGVAEFEERFSANYPPDGHYFLGFGANASIKVCDADGGMPGYPYWVTVDAPVPWGHSVEALTTDLSTLASMLLRAGMQSTPGLG